MLAVVAVLGFVGFEQAPVLGEEAKHPRRTIPAATYTRAGPDRHRVRRGGVGDGRPRRHQPRGGRRRSAGPGAAVRPVRQRGAVASRPGAVRDLLFAAALAFHNAVWRYAFALGRENVLPAALGRTGGNNIPKAASLAQSATGLAVIGAYALAGQNPMARPVLLARHHRRAGHHSPARAPTSAAVIAFFARDPRGENRWRRLAAPALAAILLAAIAVLAIMHYATLLGVAPGDPAAWALPGQLRRGRGGRGVAGDWSCKARRPAIYATIGLGPHAITGQPHARPGDAMNGASSGRLAWSALALPIWRPSAM